VRHVDPDDREDPERERQVAVEVARPCAEDEEEERRECRPAEEEEVGAA
jgi:hypothetical protein